jgi:hypothetical protein
METRKFGSLFGATSLSGADLLAVTQPEVVNPINQKKGMTQKVTLAQLFEFIEENLPDNNDEALTALINNLNGKIDSETTALGNKITMLEKGAMQKAACHIENGLAMGNARWFRLATAEFDEDGYLGGIMSVSGTTDGGLLHGMANFSFSMSKDDNADNARYATVTEYTGSYYPGSIITKPPSPDPKIPSNSFLWEVRLCREGVEAHVDVSLGKAVTPDDLSFVLNCSVVPLKGDWKLSPAYFTNEEYDMIPNHEENPDCAYFDLGGGGY